MKIQWRKMTKFLICTYFTFLLFVEFVSFYFLLTFPIYLLFSVAVFTHVIHMFFPHHTFKKKKKIPVQNKDLYNFCMHRLRLFKLVFLNSLYLLVKLQQHTKNHDDEETYEKVYVVFCLFINTNKFLHQNTKKKGKII